MLQQAMNLVMDHEKVQRHQSCLQFQLVYESVFNESLNAKRSSTCETAGRKIVVEKTMPLFKKEIKELFTVEDLCKLRRAETEFEKDTSFWFFRTFLCRWTLPVGC
jgi:hypothetical protein